MILNRKGPALFYQFPHLAEFNKLFHGIFTRHKGESKPPYASLNIGFRVGDDARHVRRNRKLIQETAGVDHLVFLRQVHGSEIFVLRKDRAADAAKALKKPPAADAVVTNLKHHGLVVQLADCQPVLLYDPGRQVIAAVHSGWRGSLLNIIGRAVERMVKDFDCTPARMYAGIGPSLGPCCGEFVNYLKEIPSIFWPYKNGDNHFNFWAISRDQLLQAGLQDGNIACSEICSKCRKDQFFSYRAEGLTGRFAAVVALL